jgi:hypothetical protein
MAVLTGYRKVDRMADEKVARWGQKMAEKMAEYWVAEWVDTTVYAGAD